MKKENVTDVVNSILMDLELIKNLHIEVRDDCPYDRSMKERMDGSISALEKAIETVKKYCS